MKRLVLIVCILLLASPSFAYVVGSVQEEVSPSISSNTVKIQTTGVAQQLGTGTPCSKVTIFNRGTYEVWVGDSNVAVGFGYPINPGAATTGNTITIATNNVANIYIVGTREAGPYAGRVCTIIEKR